MADYYFEWWNRDENGFYNFLTVNFASLWILSSSVYPVLVEKFNMMPIQKRSPEEREELMDEAKRHCGDDHVKTSRMCRAIAVIIHIGETRISKQQP
jgi:hypothetical protein